MPCVNTGTTHRPLCDVIRQCPPGVLRTGISTYPTQWTVGQITCTCTCNMYSMQLYSRCVCVYNVRTYTMYVHVHCCTASTCMYVTHRGDVPHTALLENGPPGTLPLLTESSVNTKVANLTYMSEHSVMNIYMYV